MANTYRSSYDTAFTTLAKGKTSRIYGTYVLPILAVNVTSMTSTIGLGKLPTQFILHDYSIDTGL